MDEATNGHKDGQIWVSFGPRDSQEMHLETAEYILTELARARNPRFRALLEEALLGPKADA